MDQVGGDTYLVGKVELETLPMCKILNKNISSLGIK